MGQRANTLAGLTALLVTIAFLGCSREKSRPIPRVASASVSVPDTLFQLLRPVALSNCELQRFGEPNDGGYLMCGNLLTEVAAGYSYGISGYDQWGCDVASKRAVTVHQYDCFNPTRPVCASGRTVFHDECVAGTPKQDGDRFFDTIKNQLEKNGDGGKRVVVKIDVEAAEWDSFLYTPDAVLERIDQIAVEFHGVNDEKYVAALQLLTKFFYVAHVHFNNATCVADATPFRAWAYEVLLVNKRIGVVDPSRAGAALHPLDAPNNPQLPDCTVQSGDWSAR